MRSHFRFQSQVPCLKIGTLLPDLLEASLDALKARQRRCRVDHEEGMSCCYTEPPHCRKLKVAFMKKN